MDLIGILTGVAPYALAALVITVIVIGAAFLVYRAYKKKGGKRTVSKLQCAVAFLLIAWFIVVLGLTTLSRGANYNGWINLRLFSGYVSAWNSWSLSEFQMIIFNMLMFLPLGFLLPLLGKRFRSVSRIFLITLSVTAGIELLQMLTRMGIFELDDLLHNAIGSMAGYFLIAAMLACVENKKVMIKPVLTALVIPLFFTALFSTAMIIYSARELGNLPVKPAIPQNMSGVTIQLAAELPEPTETAAMYQNSSIHNMEYGETIRDSLMNRFGLEQKGGGRIDGSNRAFVLTAADGTEYIYNYSLSDGTWSLRIPDLPDEPVAEDILQQQSETLGAWMLESGLLSSESQFSVQDEQILRWDSEEPEAIATDNDDFFSGVVMVWASSHSDIPNELFYAMARYSYIRTVEIISPEEAFAEVERGNFSEYNDMQAGDVLSVQSCALAYGSDTKGFYRPLYQFEGTRNGEPWNCLIPADGQ